MKLKQVFAVLGLSVLSFFTQAKQSPTQITIRSELASPVVLADSESPNYLKISLVGNPVTSETRVPINLSLVIDRSGSMSGERIAKAKEAAIMAINMLNEDDMVSVIAYDSRAQVIIPATKVKDKKKLIRTIENNIHAGGMTALFAGLSKGINQVDKYLDKEKVNRVILLSDGQANVGPTSVGELSELAMIAAKKGIAVTTVGLGADYNETLMASIASYSDGNHAFVEKSADLEAVFVREFKDVMSVVAQEVTVTIKLNNGVKPIRLLGRTGQINNDEIIVNMNQLYANQEKYVLLEVTPEKGQINQQKDLATVSVKYENLINKKSDSYQDIVKINYTDKSEVVKKSQVEEVIVESELQKIAIKNDEALEMYDRGDIEGAREILSSNQSMLDSFSDKFSSSAAKQRIEVQTEKNQMMAESIDEDSSDVYRKKVKDLQYDLKQSSIKSN